MTSVSALFEVEAVTRDAEFRANIGTGLTTGHGVKDSCRPKEHEQVANEQPGAIAWIVRLAVVTPTGRGVQAGIAW